MAKNQWDLKSVRQELARRKLIKFCEYTKEDWVTNWHHKLIADKLDEVVDGTCKKLIIMMPPRVGKSETATRRFPAYALGKDPDLQIISASYSADLSSRMNRDVQRIIDSIAYSEVFPNTRLSSKNVKTMSQHNYLRNSEIFEIVDHKGTYRSAGIGGGITGMGADIAIIDDPIKDAMEARSLRARDNVWDWYQAALSTRLEKSGCVVVIMTRWHEDDLVGRLLKNPDSWDVLELEAIKETNQDYDHRESGKAIWPDKFDEERYAEIKKDVGTRVWQSLYQQKPRPQEGTIIKHSWINYCNSEIPRGKIDMIQSWDLTFKGNDDSDYVVGSVWAKRDADYFLLDVFRGKWEFSEVLKIFEIVAKKWPGARRKIIEDAANAAALQSVLKSKVEGIVLWKPKTDKMSRLQAVSPLFEAGNIYFSKDIPNVDELIEETTGFPFAKNDDFVDSMTQALLNFESSNSSIYLGKKRKIAKL